jgi:hypothetical protein
MLKVIGAGFGRTGTMSLKLALEKLLASPCHHMVEVFARPEHIPLWHRAARGESVDWDEIFQGFAAAVDVPSCSFWKELSQKYPDALVLLSYRDPESWWKSASSTIFPSIEKGEGEWRAMMDELLKNKFTLNLSDRAACIEAFNRHNESVQNAGLGSRLIEWQPGDGWEPLCKALNLPVPNEPFPHTNSTAEFVQKNL